ncbi:MAG TPA: FG-GAP-like repeat-containing protein [Ignavibacteriaceae bacterium]|nr:FG-GAP-like repeat-containing protein [Ignavibacteriaceae bacterium]
MKFFMMNPFRLLLIAVLFWFLGPLLIFAQTFTKITDPGNPIATTTLDQNYSGAAWIDYDGDGDLDLYTTKTYLFRNEGNGNFTLLSTGLGMDMEPQLGNGISWGDYDNDGDPDAAIAGKSSLIYRNDGSDSFTVVDELPLGINEDNRGWACAWGDYDNDGFLDLVITHPKGFLGSPYEPCFLLHNDGDGRFTKITGYEFTDDLHPYTVATWYDFDQDGDIDLFIASGPAVGSGARDFLYRNMLKETGSVDFVRIDDLLIGTDLQDGQTWNFIDYDNDGDYDAFITNYGGAPDHFYRNDSGTFVSLSNALTVIGQHLANTWGDVDNDGDLDVVVTGESGTSFNRNDDGAFVNDTTGFTLSGSPRGAVFGDYDNDGDLDLFVSGTGNSEGLFRNDNSNGFHWLEIICRGSVSNKSAIGTRIKMKAMINGNSVWQLRDISGQNSFDSQNSLIVHFGLGSAVSADSLVIMWPSGQSKTYTNLAVDQLYTYDEEIPSGFLRPNFSADKISGVDSLTVQFSDLTIADPGKPVISWEWDFNNDGTVDATDQNPLWVYGSPGIYTVKLTVSNGTTTQSKMRKSYINVENSTGVELNGEGVPDKFELFQNYPNPFNPSTKIRYNIPDISGKPGIVTLKVYDVLGKDVAVLVNEIQSPGIYEVNFSPAVTLPSGIYFYRISAPGYTSVRKMILLK